MVLQVRRRAIANFTAKSKTPSKSKKHLKLKKKKYKSKSVSQRKGKRLHHPKHDLMRVEQASECSWEKSWETKIKKSKS